MPTDYQISHEDLFSNSILELTILPTEKCNFRCSYCYETFHIGSMENRIIEAIKLLIKSRVKELTHLRIGWFGGEPLLEKRSIMDIAVFVKKMSQKYTELHYDSGMSTNGYLLTLKTAEMLIENGINHFQISFDGPKDYHDSVRPLINGSGTFKRIWNNLVCLKNSSLNFHVNLRVHFSKANIHLVKDFINDLNIEFGSDDRFHLFLKPLADLGGSQEASHEYFEKKEAKIIKKNLESQVSKNFKLIMETGSDYICYAARPTSFVIRPDGNLVKCTVGLDDPENQIGQILGNGSLKIDQERIRPWLEGAVELNKNKLRCPRAAINTM